MNATVRLRQLLAEAADESGIALSAEELDVLAERVTVKATQGMRSVLRLTPRLTDVLQGLAAGEQIPDTAARLFVSGDTVKTHRRLLYARLGASTGAHAVAIASTQGLLLPIGTATTSRRPARVLARKGGRS
ncbi:response regulator transcription factor [Streptomyces monashensis]|uniref:response regulator transcription factor n=1 Tax=Streptomyces monashensis TaxID=1678012 RepID=UPI003F54050B